MKIGTASHLLHRRQSIARMLNRPEGQRIWTLYWHIDRLFIRVELGIKPRGEGVRW